MEILGRTGGGGVGIQKQKHFKGSMKLIKIRIFRVVVEGRGGGGLGLKLKNLWEGYEYFWNFV